MTDTKDTQKQVISQPDFRAYEPEWVSAPKGEEFLLQLCEELDPESNRWEPFYAILNRRKQAK